MMLLIYLTDTMGKRFLLIVNHVETFVPLRNGECEIIFASGRHITVTETVEEIEAAISQTMTVFK